MPSQLCRPAVHLAMVAALFGSVLLLAAPEARASFHFVMVTEVYAGSAELPDSQFVELQMYSSGQRFVDGISVDVFDAGGTKTDSFTFSAPVADGANQSSILIATAAAVQQFDVAADLAMTPVVPAAGGKVCWDTIDCVSWGNYSGSSTGTGTPFEVASGIPQGSSIARDISGGSNPAALDTGDDTDDSAADFDAAVPSPTNNTGTDASVHDRSVTFRVTDDALRGSVRVADGATVCNDLVPVRLQRRKDGAWRSVKSRSTEADGDYRFGRPDKPGRYRVRAPRLSLESGDTCLQATSPVRRLS